MTHIDKQIRILDLALAQALVAQGKHAEARELFAKYGIDYIPATATPRSKAP